MHPGALKTAKQKHWSSGYPSLALDRRSATGGDMKTFDAVLEDEDPPQALEATRKVFSAAIKFDVLDSSLYNDDTTRRSV